MKVDFKGILAALVKNWRDTIGSLFVILLAWLVLFEQVSYQTAGVVLTILWVGRFVNRKLDPFSAFKKDDTNA